MSDFKRTAWLAYLAPTLLGVLTLVVVPSGRAHDLVYLVMSAGVVVAISTGALMHRPLPVLPWLVMAGGQLLWLGADASYFWGLEDQPAFGPLGSPDVLYLAGYVLLTLSLWLLVHARGTDVSGALDSAIVVVGLGLVFWCLLVAPALGQGASTSEMFTAAYPLADIALLGGAVHLTIASPRRSFGLRLLAVALGCLLAADTIAAAWPGLERLADPLWVASYAFWGAAVLHPSIASRDRRVARSNRLTFPRVLAMTVTAIAAPVTLAFQALAGRQLTVWPVVIGSAVTFLLVQVRMLLAMRQIQKADEHRTRLQEEMSFRASHDSLTDLPNRVETLGLIGSALARAKVEEAMVGVLFVDLDGFKAVNDTLGHRAGDEVLREVARRLTESTRADDVATRLGGDEFVVLLPGIGTAETAHALALRIIERLSEPIRLDSGREVRVGASVGISLAEGGSTPTETLLHEADVALYRAKELGRGRAVLFVEELRTEQEARVDLEMALARAIEGDELVVHYQPILDVRTGAIRGMEALVRWDRPGVGLLGPADFLPAAEASDLVCDLDAWVLQEAVGQLKAWSSATGRPEFTVSVNIAARHAAKLRIVSDVRRALELSGVPADRLVLEIAEAAVVGDPAVARHLALLRAIGVSVSLGDFGVGLRTVSRLGELPVDSVKIGRDFLEAAAGADRVVLELMVRAAHTAGLPVVGEGVERFDQLTLLREVECESAQGYYLGRPMTAEQLLLLGATDRPEWVRQTG